MDSELDQIRAEIKVVLEKFKERGIPDPAMVAGIHPIFLPVFVDTIHNLMLEKGIYTEEEFELAKAKQTLVVLNQHLENTIKQQRENLTAGVPKMAIPGEKLKLH